MKAIVTRKNEDGTYDEVGMNNKFLTSQYKTVSGLIRHGIPKHWKDRGIKIEIFYGSIYRDSDRVLYI
jgi:hypothetical protein